MNLTFILICKKKINLRLFFNKPVSLQQIHTLDSGVSVSEMTTESRDSDCGTSTEDINSSELYRTGFRGKSIFVPSKVEMPRWTLIVGL